MSSADVEDRMVGQRDYFEGGRGGESSKGMPTPVQDRETGTWSYVRQGSPEVLSSKGASHQIDTPTAGHKEHRSVDAERMTNGGGGHEATRLRAPRHRMMHAPGPQTFDQKYMPFAAGFAHMADEAAVYRSSRLHAINPTAAVTDDISYFYTLDSGRVPPAVVAANPETSAEFVRNTASETHGGMFRRLMKPIE